MRGDDELERDNFSEFSFERLADQTSVSRGSFQVSYIFLGKMFGRCSRSHFEWGLVQHLKYGENCQNLQNTNQ